jgi:hypothetical protein
MLTLIDLKAEFKASNPNADPFGCTLSWLYAACDALTFEHDVPVPTDWHLIPSPFGPNGSYEYDTCTEANPQALLAFGALLLRAHDALVQQQVY